MSLKDSNDGQDASNLSELFDNAFALFNDINKTNESTNSIQVQMNVKRAMTMFEDATRLVSLVDMFSANESFEEVATENIKYFLLPALLGTLATKLCNVEDRMHLVEVSEIYFVDFLKRVKEYGLVDLEIPEKKSEDSAKSAVEKSKSEAEMIMEMVSRRNTKLQRYKEQKDLESRLDVLQKNLDNPNVDDEIKREYFVTLIKIYVGQAIDELSSLSSERQILEHMKKVGHADGQDTEKKHKTPAAKLQPIIITRDVVQKQVYGAGYPSLPVLTVQEFYDQKIKDGEWPDPSQRNQAGGRCLQDMAASGEGNTREEQEAIEKEEEMERDDPEALERARAMDEYKDTHRRGWGNRANRS